MYSTCLFCNRDLGTNEAIEHFPVGRRLAYDAAKGRLWVVCRACERWNLTPLEERWEAIEECERLFRGTRLRIATDNVGLARVADGMELVRIGEPLRPEFAAWRYGDQFGRRRLRQAAIAGVGLAALGAVVAGGAAAGVSIGSFGWLLGLVGTNIYRGSANAVVARIPVDGSPTLVVERGHLAESTLGSSGEGTLAIVLRHVEGRTRLEGRDAERVVAVLMPHVNRFGGSRRAVQDAVGTVERFGGPEGFLRRVGPMAHQTTRPPAKVPSRWSWGADIPNAGLFGLATEHRLALEMALHEESERRAMAGELAELEEAWRSAEEIAAISDDLLLPDGVRARLERLRGSR